MAERSGTLSPPGEQGRAASDLLETHFADAAITEGRSGLSARAGKVECFVDRPDQVAGIAIRAMLREVVRIFGAAGDARRRNHRPDPLLPRSLISHEAGGIQCAGLA